MVACTGRGWWRWVPGVCGEPADSARNSVANSGALLPRKHRDTCGSRSLPQACHEHLPGHKGDDVVCRAAPVAETRPATGGLRRHAVRAHVMHAVDPGSTEQTAANT